MGVGEGDIVGLRMTVPNVLAITIFYGIFIHILWGNI